MQQIKELCIIIESKYPNDVDDEKQRKKNQQYQTEIDQDHATMYNMLKNDHDIHTITVPVNSKVNQALKQTLSTDSHKILNKAMQKREYNRCHIVLNTHGESGSSDLQDEVIKYYIQQCSECDIKIHQISALQCNAFKKRTKQDLLDQKPMMPGQQYADSVPIKVNTRSSMDILLARLNKLETKHEEKFQLRGPLIAYIPNNDQKLISDILLGENNNDIQTVEVQTQKFNPNEIEETIKIFKEEIVKLNELSQNPTDKEYKDCEKHCLQLRSKIEMAFAIKTAKIYSLINSSDKTFTDIHNKLNPEQLKLFSLMIEQYKLKNNKEEVSLDELTQNNCKCLNNDFKKAYKLVKTVNHTDDNNTITKVNEINEDFLNFAKSNK